MSLKSDLKKIREQQEDANKIQKAISIEMQGIIERIKKGESTGDTLEDFCMVNQSANDYFKDVDSKLKSSRKGLILGVTEEEYQVSCSITHGTYDWARNYVIGVQFGHEWDVTKNELVVFGKFAEKRQRRYEEYRILGNEYRIAAHDLAMARYSLTDTGMPKARGLFGFLVGDEVTKAILNKDAFNYQLRYGLKYAFNLIEYTPDAQLENRVL